MATEATVRAGPVTSGPLLRLGERCYPFVWRFFSAESQFVADLDRKLGEAHMPDNVEMYLSTAMGIGLLLGAGAWLAGIAGSYLVIATGAVRVTTIVGLPVSHPAVLAVVDAARVPLLILASGCLLGAVGFSLGFAGTVAVPYVRASAREREINLLLSDAIAYMYALSLGGMNQLEAMEALADAEDTYGEVAREFEAILKETRYSETDYRSAIQHRARRCPSDELSQFLTDLLSIVESGGDVTSFLDDQKEAHRETVRRQQAESLDALELFGEMYLSISVFPLLLLIILVVMRLLGGVTDEMLLVTVYVLTPVLGAAFLVLVSTVNRDEPSDGYLELEDDWFRLESARTGLLDLGVVERFAGTYPIFRRIRRREAIYRAGRALRRPHYFFREHPTYTAVLTVPAAVALVGLAVAAHAAPTTWAGLIARPVWGTVVYVYVPLYLVGVPLATFHAWNRYSRRAVLGGISEDLRKLASTNETGLTILESLRTVAETSRGKIAREFRHVSAQVEYGMRLTEALIDFNNRYHHPRLARTVKLVSKAQETSNRISTVLSTAAAVNRDREDLERERRTRTRIQVVVVIMTFLTMLGVVAVLKLQLLDVLARLAAQIEGGGSGAGTPGFGAAVDVDLLSLLFFHAVVLQAIVSGLVSGYVQNGDVFAGVRYVVVLASVALVVWMGVA